MHWLGNFSCSSSSTSESSSPSTTAQKQHSSQRDVRKRVNLAPRLLRQKNLRYLSDDEIAGALQAHQSDSLPLPLPELSAVRKKEEGDCPLPSPEEARMGREKGDGGGGGGAMEGSSSRGCISAHQAGKKVAEHVDTRLTVTMSQELKSVENSKDKFRLDVRARSAPTSAFSSPVLSPQRLSSDLHPNYVSPKGGQTWSSPELPTSIQSPTFPEYSHKRYSTDSPLQSPHVKGPSMSRGIGVPLSPFHPKSYFDPSIRHDSTSHVGVHPLPLPPVVGTTPSAPNSQVPSKLEPLRLKCRWQKGKLIGRGTFGSVYVATNRETGALCAMKEVELFPDDPKSIESMKQMEQEIKVLSQLKHPNIVQYYGSEIVEDRFYIYLEYVHPGSINKYVRDHVGAITESVVRNFTRHILSGLAYLHSKKTIHRDIKGANLLVDASGVVKLADFGMAKHLSGQAADLSLRGSPYWMAPELMQAVIQKENSSDLALAVDIWSLGCTIIEMLTGKPPWSEYEGAAAMFKVLTETPPIPETLSTEGKEFLRCCFQRNPAERPSAATLLEHPFLRNSQQLDVPSCSEALTGMKLMEAHQSPADLPRHSVDLFRHSGDQSLYSMDLLPSVQKTNSKATTDSLMHYAFSPVRLYGNLMKLPT